MSQKTARKLGLLGTNNQPINGYKWGRDYFSTIASGESIRIKSIDNVPLTFADYSQETVTGMVTITMDETSSSLFGVNMIRKVKTLKIKNK